MEGWNIIMCESRAKAGFIQERQPEHRGGLKPEAEPSQGKAARVTETQTRGTGQAEL